MLHGLLLNLVERSAIGGWRRTSDVSALRPYSPACDGSTSISIAAPEYGWLQWRYPRAKFGSTIPRGRKHGGQSMVQSQAFWHNGAQPEFARSLCEFPEQEERE